MELVSKTDHSRELLSKPSNSNSMDNQVLQTTQIDLSVRVNNSNKYDPSKNNHQEKRDEIDSKHNSSTNFTFNSKFTDEKHSSITLPGLDQFDRNCTPDDNDDASITVDFNCTYCLCLPGTGLIDDFRRRCGYYLSDYTDGILGHRNFYKTCSTTIFLYISVLLPCIAFGVVDTNNTDGQIDPKKTMIGQAVGGFVFAIISGQPLVVIMTTAPLCIYVKVIYQISQSLEVDFEAFYACVGLWMSLFLIIFSITNLSELMKYCTRSTEDVFAIFTALAFGSDGVKEALRSFHRYYWNPECVSDGNSAATSVVVRPQYQKQENHSSSDFFNTRSNSSNDAQKLASVILSHLMGKSNSSQSSNDSFLATATTVSSLEESTTTNLSPMFSDTSLPLSSHQHDPMSFPSRCQRETCILFLFLMFGTLWLANSFSSFDKTPYLSSRKREIIKDYALALSVLLFSFVGSYIFMDIHLDVFEFSEFSGIQTAQLNLLSMKAILASSGLGFMLSVLFYIDQNICGAMVNNAPYQLKKGNYFHLDLFVLAILNAALSVLGLPFMHGKLPHSHLHSKALADYEEQTEGSRVKASIVNIRETRLTQLFCSILIGLSLMAVPYPIAYIPLPVLSGVFLYTALAEFKSNSMAERICLLFTEPAAYPSNHYTRKCPRQKIHLFTFAQVAQLAIVSFVGFYPNPYVNMAFPLVIATFVPLRTLILPHLIEPKYLQALDKYSME